MASHRSVVRLLLGALLAITAAGCVDPAVGARPSSSGAPTMAASPSAGPSNDGASATVGPTASVDATASVGPSGSLGPSASVGAIPSGPSASVLPTRSATPSAPASPAASRSTAGALPHVDPGLEAMLPRAIADVPTIRFSAAFGGADPGPGGCLMFCAGFFPQFVKEVGIDWAAMTGAVAFAPMPDGTSYYVTAIRLPGISTRTFIPAWLAARAGTAHPTTFVARMGSRKVTVGLFGPCSVGAVDVLYTKSDVLFVIEEVTTPASTTDCSEPDAAIKAIVAHLP